MSSAVIDLQNGRLMISGALDFSSVNTLLQMSLPLLAGCSEWNFDLSQVTATKSAGLVLLLEWIKLARQKQKTITFTSLPSQMVSIAGVCGVAKLFSARN